MMSSSTMRAPRWIPAAVSATYPPNALPRKIRVPREENVTLELAIGLSFQYGERASPAPRGLAVQTYAPGATDRGLTAFWMRYAAVVASPEGVTTSTVYMSETEMPSEPFSPARSSTMPRTIG